MANNLYPFAATVASPDATHADILENIDIGGVTLLRAAAKNYRHVVPLCRPQDYKEVLAALREQGNVGEALRLRLATEAFRHVAEYDAAIAVYFDGLPTGG